MNRKERKQRIARQILANPARYQVCEGCDSVLNIRHDLCPNCRSYRFTREDQAVVTAVIEILQGFKIDWHPLMPLRATPGSQLPESAGQRVVNPASPGRSEGWSR